MQLWGPGMDGDGDAQFAGVNLQCARSTMHVQQHVSQAQQHLHQVQVSNLLHLCIKVLLCHNVDTAGLQLSTAGDILLCDEPHIQLLREAQVGSHRVQ